MKIFLSVLVSLTVLSSCNKSPAPLEPNEADPFGRGPYPVGSTNMEVAPDFAAVGDEVMHEYLLGRAEVPDQPRYITDLLRHPDSAWVTEVDVPDDVTLYGPASGLTLPVVTFLTFPTRNKEHRNEYVFPYHDGAYGVFEDMLGANEKPDFADPHERYPLVIVAHGTPAHGVYDVSNAHTLASHGYIVAVINYGDERTVVPDTPNRHVGFLRPYLTKAVLDSILESDSFGAHIDVDNIGITGHSYGGFTALASSGAPILGNKMSVHDARIKAISIAAPWVGGHYDGETIYAFASDNMGLSKVSVPTICFYGTNDEASLASFILPAMKKLSGPTFVVELVDQPHVFADPSWEDRNNWELLFFSAYLKNNPESLETLRVARSMRGGNEDHQLMDYQRLVEVD